MEAAAGHGKERLDGAKPRLKGHPVQILKARADHSFELDDMALGEILLDSRVKDKSVVILSVAGDYRKGKSFFLNMCLRYLHAGGSLDWLKDDDLPLEGFSWCNGIERNTTGILIWSEPFIQTLLSGEQVAILLMDTQGTFDSSSTVGECATVFALSTLLSSVQVFNVMSNLQENDLQQLQTFTEYGRMAMEESETQPFQKLMFLVRDWQCPYDMPYGLQGGTMLLNRRLQVLLQSNNHMYFSNQLT